MRKTEPQHFGCQADKKLSVSLFEELEAFSGKGWGTAESRDSIHSELYHLCPDHSQVTPLQRNSALMGGEPHWWSFIFHSWLAVSHRIILLA